MTGKRPPAQFIPSTSKYFYRASMQEGSWSCAGHNMPATSDGRGLSYLKHAAYLKNILKTQIPSQSSIPFPNPIYST
jgi:hypothetical protein